VRWTLREAGGEKGATSIMLQAVALGLYPIVTLENSY
jgi:hypothetical protein